MIIDCQWLPELLQRNPGETDNDYIKRLYKIFINDFITHKTYFSSLTVKIRYEPYIDGRVQTFYHVITVGESSESRVIDEDRCLRVRWIKAFIENATCHKSSCAECSGVKLWSAPYHSYSRIMIFLEEEKYLVVLERRPKYILLITAYYVTYSHSLSKLRKQYEKAKSASGETLSDTPSTLP